MLESVNISGMTWHECPECGEKFYSKSDKCPYCAKKEREKPPEPIPVKIIKHKKKAYLVYKCPKCGKPVVLKDIKEANDCFYGCGDYPNCDFKSSVESIDDKAEKMYYYDDLRETCPLCGDEVIRLKRKDFNFEFYSCKNFDCDFAFSLQDDQFMKKHEVED